MFVRTFYEYILADFIIIGRARTRASRFNLAKGSLKGSQISDNAEAEPSRKKISNSAGRNLTQQKH